jgi:hypothetical protein
VRIRITNQPGKYAALSRKGDLLVVSKMQAGEFFLPLKCHGDRGKWSAWIQD